MVNLDQGAQLAGFMTGTTLLHTHYRSSGTCGFREDLFLFFYSHCMACTRLIVLDPEIPFTLPQIKGISGTDGANYKVIK